jgi:hypothetical protein
VVEGIVWPHDGCCPVAGGFPLVDWFPQREYGPVAGGFPPVGGFPQSNKGWLPIGGYAPIKNDLKSRVSPRLDVGRIFSLSTGVVPQ